MRTPVRSRRWPHSTPTAWRSPSVPRRADVSRQWLYTQPEPAAPRAPGHTPGEGQKEVVEATDRAAAQDPGNAPWAGDPVGRPALLAESSVGRSEAGWVSRTP